MGFRLINPLKHGPNQIRCFSKWSSQLQSHGPTLSLCINVRNQYHLSHQWMSLLDADGSCLSCVLQMWWSSRIFCAPAVWWVEYKPLPSGATASWPRWAVFSGRGNGGKRKMISWSRALQVRQAGLCCPFILI